VKTGNAVLAIAFLYLAFRLPVDLYQFIVDHHLVSFFPVNTLLVSGTVFLLLLIGFFVSIATGSELRIRGRRHKKAQNCVVPHKNADDEEKESEELDRRVDTLLKKASRR
jgi:hypothetical protein